jgi:uncharacterized glyoxalase superfamily protein PhnB
MFSSAKNTRATVIPCLRNGDAPVAIEWLCRAFGIEKHLVVPGDKGTIVHAQLSFGNGMIMLGSVVDTDLGRMMKQPKEVGGAETQCPYVVVADADAHYARAKAAGAPIVMDIKDEDYGGRGYSCRDLEGHLWNGTYDPWAGNWAARAADPARRARCTLAIVTTTSREGAPHRPSSATL